MFSTAFRHAVFNILEKGYQEKNGTIVFLMLKMVAFEMKSESGDLEKVNLFLETETFAVRRQFQNVLALPWNLICFHA